MSTNFFFSFPVCFRGCISYAVEFIYKIIIKGQAKKPSLQLEHSHALVITGTTTSPPAVVQKATWQSCAHALAIGSLRQRASVVVLFRPAVISWLSTVIYPVPNQDSRIRGVCKCTVTTLSNPTRIPNHTFSDYSERFVHANSVLCLWVPYSWTTSTSGTTAYEIIFGRTLRTWALRWWLCGHFRKVQVLQIISKRIWNRVSSETTI